MKVKISKLKRDRASDSVFQVLRESILNQTFRPGERLNIKELADKLGTSRTPVKDAINRLASEGLIELRPRSGTFVAELSPDDITETFEVRLGLECLAAEIAIERATPETILKLKELVAAMEIPVTNQRERAYHEQKNTEFHSFIVEMSGNRKLIEVYRSINAHVKFARIHYPADTLAYHLEAEKRDHREILDALESKDEDRLVRLLKQHIRAGAQALVKELRRPKSSASPSASLIGKLRGHHGH